MGYELHVLLYQEAAGDQLVWIAQCLNHDIVAYGASVVEAQRSFQSTLASEIAVAIARGQTPLQAVEPAPAHFQKMWKEGVALERRLPVGEAIDEISSQNVRREVPRGEAVFRLSA